MADAKSDRYTAEPEFTIGEIRVQTTRGFDYFHVGAETTMDTLGPTIGEVMVKLEAARREGRPTVLGPAVFVYSGEDPNGPFTLQVGYPVESGTSPAGATEVCRLGDFHCLSAIFTGGLQHIRVAWDTVKKAMGERGLSPSPESRELYLLFEDDTSPNNVTLLQLGIAVRR